MSCCPTDVPVLKSILGLHRPAADCLLSLSCCFNILSLSISTNLFFFCVFTPTVTYRLPLFFPVSVSLTLLRPISLLLTFSSFSPLICGPIQPSFSYSSASHSLDTQITLSALTLYVSLYHSLFIPFPFCSVQLFHSLLVFHFQAANGEQNNYD